MFAFARQSLRSTFPTLQSSYCHFAFVKFVIRSLAVAVFPRTASHLNSFKISFIFLRIYRVLYTIAIMPSPIKKVRKFSNEDVLAFSKLSEHGFAPTKGSEHAAGYDLRSAYPYVVKAHGKELIKTDIQIKVPQGTYGRVAPRSGLAWKNFIDVGAGVIDSDYRGNVGVILYNHSDEDFTVNKGDRVAQLICEKIVYPEVVEFETLDETERGEGGFGSTGTN